MISKVKRAEPWSGIERQTPILFIGSCFSENIGFDFQKKKWATQVNPFGITYNPLSAMKQLIWLAEDRTYSESDLIQSGELWCSFDHHGKYASVEPSKVLEQIHADLHAAKTMMQRNPVLFLTFGTGWVWVKKDSGEIVNNCHKLPGHQFARELPSLEALMQTWSSMRVLWPDTRFVVSISPVRYDDAVANARGKALLHLFCHELEKRGDILYFPAYEIMHHELRDYRFYTTDRKHPTDEAVDYIRQIFHEWALSADARQWYRDYAQYLRNKTHRPLHPGTKEAKTFQEKVEKQYRSLQQSYPDMF